MPVITLPYTDLEDLTSSESSEIISRIPMIGADVERIENDYIDIEFFPDRPDLYSVEGVSRAMRGFLGIEKGFCQYNVIESNFKLLVDKGLLKIRPNIVCAVVKGINFDSNSIKTIMDLQEDLHWGLGRNRKKVSIGVHDLNHVQSPFRYLPMDKSFKFIPLDFSNELSLEQILVKHPKGKAFAHILDKFDKYPIILDKQDKVLSFPPIINGNLTRVTEDTTDLFIDVTGLDDTVNIALNIVVTALAERGGTIESVSIEDWDGNVEVTPNLKPVTWEIKKKDIEDLLGIPLRDRDIVENLEKMRYGVRKIDPETFEVDIPAYRADILHSYDIIEDIAICYGFDQIIPQFPESSTVGSGHSSSIKEDKFRELMIGLGYFQVMPFTLTNEKVHFEMMCREKTPGVTYLLHPISEEQTMLRTNLLPNLLEILSLNQHRELPQRIFEVGEIVENEINKHHLAAVSIHPFANFTEIQELIDVIMREQGLEYNLVESNDSAFLEGRRANIVVGEKVVGVMGEFYPKVITSFGLGQPVVGFEMQI